jgi:transcriptional regulator with XRE-family HTH domain
MANLALDEEHQVLQEILREGRLVLKLRQIELAERLGQYQSFVSKYESGERRLDVFELRRVCNALGLSLTDVLKEVDIRLERTGVL